MSRNPKHQPHQIAIGEAIQTTLTGEDVPAGVVAAEAAHNAATEPVEGIAARPVVYAYQSNRWGTCHACGDLIAAGEPIYSSGSLGPMVCRSCGPRGLEA